MFGYDFVNENYELYVPCFEKGGEGSLSDFNH